jgi:hypothetical protein
VRARQIWRGIAVVAGAVAGVALLGAALLFVVGWLLLDVAFNPSPHADTRLRAYLGAVQVEDWATAAQQVDDPSPGAPGALQKRWDACTTAHGRITAYRVSTRPLDPGHATATLTFADGTRDRWSVYMNPKRGPGWKLLGSILPPACSGVRPQAAQPLSRPALRDAFRYGAVAFSAVELPTFAAPRPYVADYLF